MKRILLVEDENDLSYLYKDILVEAGFEVMLAKDGTEASEKWLSYEWDLLLLDIMLPDKDGMSILEDIKNSDKKSLPVVILTNLNNPDVEKRAYSLGVSGFLVKSEVNMDDIVDISKKLLS